MNHDDEFEDIIAGMQSDEEAPEESEVSEGLLTVEGFRLFNYKGHKLTSYSARYIWTPGINQAVCFAGAHVDHVLRNKEDGSGVEQVEISSHGRIPDEDCECGFWVYKTPELLLSKQNYFGGSVAPYNKRYSRSRLGKAKNAFGDFSGLAKEGFIPGKVRMWGKVIIGEDGFRAEFAEVSALYTVDSDADIEAIAQRYGCELVSDPDLAPMRKSITGVLQHIGPLVMGSSGRHRPRDIIVRTIDDDSDPLNNITDHKLKVWNKSDAWDIIDAGGIGATLKLFLKQDDMGSLMVEDAELLEVGGF